MIKNYIQTFFRNFRRNSAFSLINVFGLFLGITFTYFIGLFLVRELAYDKFHEHANNIYRIAWMNQSPQTRTPHPLAQEMVREFPEVESGVSLSPLWGPGLTKRTFSIRNKEKDIQFDEASILAVDSTFFDVFDFKLIIGDKKKALNRPGGILLSQSAARRYFDGANPIGKFLSVNNDNILFEVTGVFEDVPELAHFHFHFLISYVTQKAADPDDEFFTWKDFGHYNYVRLKPGADPKALENKLMPWLRKYVDWSKEDFEYLTNNGYGFDLQPLTDIHLKSRLRWELEQNGNMDYVVMVASAGVLLLIVVAFNFINLTNANSIRRTKEVGVRKSLGSTQRKLFYQFTMEAIFIALVAGVFSMIAIGLLIPVFNKLTDATIIVSPLQIGGFVLTTCVLVGILAGLYPSVVMSRVSATHALKGQLTKGPKGAFLQNSLLVFQFVASLLLVFSCIVIYSQLKLVRNRPLGFDKEAVVLIPLRKGNFPTETFLKEVSRIPNVFAVSAASNIPGKGFNQNPIAAKSNPDNDIDASELFVEYDFLKTLDIKLVDGRAFDRSNPADKEQAFILNETAVKRLNLDNPVGKEIVWDNDGEFVTGSIIGVVKDFNFQSLHQTIQPLFLRLETRGFNYVVVKTSEENIDNTIRDIKDVWVKFEDRFTFEYSYLSSDIEYQYKGEKQMATVLSLFSGIAVLVAILGLIGVASLAFRNKVKEIGIRRVLGADTSSVAFLLMKDYTVLLGISTAIALPSAFFLMRQWLNNFSYKTEISILGMTGVVGLLLLCSWAALIILVLRVVKMATIQTLKSE